MLNREYASWMGSWNGVGGQFDGDETPMECILREIKEETDIDASNVKDCGIVTWKIDDKIEGGMHIFLAEVDDDFTYNTPRATEEGILDWKKIDWLMSDDNTGIVKNIQGFLPYMLNKEGRYEHTCTFVGFELIDFSSIEIT